MELHEHFNLKQLNTFHIPVKARYFVDATSIDDLRSALQFANSHGLPFMLIGQGSNLLFRHDYPGLIIEMNLKGIEVVRDTHDEVLLKAACGEIWHELVLYCLDHELYGLENLSLIPGTVGAAPVQNIGAYGVELADVFESLEALEIATGKIHDFGRADCSFGYRTSTFKQDRKDRYLITSVTLRLSRTPTVNIRYGALQQALAEVPDADITPRLVSETVCAIRSSKLPDHATLGNAGSFFWNPHISCEHFTRLQADYPDIVGYPEDEGIKVPAAWLIERAGWKGYREGDVGVHREHALVLVNYGQASGEELWQLASKIQASVRQKFEVALQPEVRII